LAIITGLDATIACGGATGDVGCQKNRAGIRRRKTLRKTNYNKVGGQCPTGQREGKKGAKVEGEAYKISLKGREKRQKKEN